MPYNLTDDQKAVVLDCVRSINLGCSGLDLDNVVDPLSIIELSFCKLAEIFNYESDLTKRNNDRYNLAKMISKENQQLKEALSGKVEAKIPYYINNCLKQVENTWRDLGFTWLSNKSNYNLFQHYNKTTLHITTKILIIESNYNNYNDPITKKKEFDKKIENLKINGLVFIERGKQYFNIINNEHAKNFIENKILEKYPSSKIIGWDYKNINNDLYVLENVSFELQLDEFDKE